MRSTISCYYYLAAVVVVVVVLVLVAAADEVEITVVSVISIIEVVPPTCRGRSTRHRHSHHFRFENKMGGAKAQ